MLGPDIAEQQPHRLVSGLRKVRIGFDAARDHHALGAAAADHHRRRRDLDPEPRGEFGPLVDVHQRDLPTGFLAEALDDRPLHAAVSAARAREHHERELPGLAAKIVPPDLLLLGPHRGTRVPDHRVGGLGAEFGVMKHRDLGDAGEGAGLSPRKVLQAPEIGDGIDREHGRGIVALRLDQLADLRRR